MKSGQVDLANKLIDGERARFLYVNDKLIYAQIGNRLCTSDDHGMSWREYPATLNSGACAYSRLHARLLRKGVHSLRVLKDGKTLIVAKRTIQTYETVNGNVNKPFSIPRGSRPLFICEGPGGGLLWGEYFGNPGREEVNIYTSTDHAQSWEIAYTFKKNSIRHVHGVFCDPYDNRIWVTTGDDDRESGIWVTGDRFKTLEEVIGGSQQYRAIQLIFTRDYVYFGTDTPYEKNHIYRINKNSGKLEELASVENSVYWGCKVGDCLFFSTAIEPSGVNTGNHACIWGSSDGLEWQCLTKFKKDPWPMKYFQLGQIVFPQGENKTGYLFYTPLATEGDQTLQRMKVSDIF